MKMLAEGACGTVSVISDEWLVKQPKGNDGEEVLKNERKIYELLDQSWLTGRICPDYDPSYVNGLKISYLQDAECLHKALRRLDTGQVVSLLQKLSAVLAQFHACGFVHQDLHCGNVVVVAGRPFLVDFGLTTHVSLSPRVSRGWGVCIKSERMALVASIKMFCPEHHEMAQSVLI